MQPPGILAPLSFLPVRGVSPPVLIRTRILEARRTDADPWRTIASFHYVESDPCDGMSIIANVAIAKSRFLYRKKYPASQTRVRDGSPVSSPALSALLA